MHTHDKHLRSCARSDLAQTLSNLLIPPERLGVVVWHHGGCRKSMKICWQSILSQICAHGLEVLVGALPLPPLLQPWHHSRQAVTRTDLFMICLLASCVQGDIFYDMGTQGVAGLEMQIHAACGLTHTPTSKSHLEVHVLVLGPHGGQSSQITMGPIASRGHRQHVHVCACVYNLHSWICICIHIDTYIYV